MRKITFLLALFLLVTISIGFSSVDVLAGSCELPDFDFAKFDNPRANNYFPLEPKTTFVYEAETEDEFIRNDVTITKKKKKILGIDCKVVYDVEWVYIEEEGEWFITEETYDWYANDNDGNVWYFGEETEEYIYDDDWQLIDTSEEGSWEAGEDGALPGILIPAKPIPGDCNQQEYYEDEAEEGLRYSNSMQASPLNMVISITVW